MSLATLQMHMRKPPPPHHRKLSFREYPEDFFLMGCLSKIFLGLWLETLVSLVGTAEFEECTDFDCVFHGTATGNRRADDSCECICDAGYTGPQCRSIIGIAGHSGRILESDSLIHEVVSVFSLFLVLQTILHHAEYVAEGTELLGKK